jgi:hypothetical protein
MDESMQSHQSHMIKLISAEGHEFFVNRKCAMVSGTIKAMLSGLVPLCPSPINNNSPKVNLLREMARLDSQKSQPLSWKK